MSERELKQKRPRKRRAAVLPKRRAQSSRKAARGKRTDDIIITASMGRLFCSGNGGRGFVPATTATIERIQRENRGIRFFGLSRVEVDRLQRMLGPDYVQTIAAVRDINLPYTNSKL